MNQTSEIQSGMASRDSADRWSSEVTQGQDIQNKIKVLSSQEALQLLQQPQQLQPPIKLGSTCRCIVKDKKRNCYLLSNSNNRSICVYNEDFKLIKEIGNNKNLSISYPWGIIVDKNNNYIISDEEAHKIIVTNYYGHFISSIDHVTYKNKSKNNVFPKKLNKKCFKKVPQKSCII